MEAYSIWNSLRFPWILLQRAWNSLRQAWILLRRVWILLRRARARSFAGYGRVEPRQPRRLVANRGAELKPRGAAAGGEVEALAVEADRPPASELQDPGGGFVSS